MNVQTGVERDEETFPPPECLFFLVGRKGTENELLNMKLNLLNEFPHYWDLLGKRYRNDDACDN